MANPYNEDKVKAGPPHIISVDFQPKLRTTSLWLRQEIKNAALCSPFIITVAGSESKPFESSFSIDAGFSELEVELKLRGEVPAIGPSG